MIFELPHGAEVTKYLRAVLKLLKTYFRISVEGIEHIPRSGGAIVIPNHSGYAGTDAVLLNYLIKRETRRRARILAHRAFFDFSDRLGGLAKSFGLKRASLDAGVEILKARQLMLLFPEGEAGNFKSSLKRYQLARFRTGFLRMAIEARVPIIPCVIVGAEESHVNLGNLNLGKIAKGIRIPLPILALPLPAKWKIRFLEPIAIDAYLEIGLNDRVALEKAADEIREKVQEALYAELRARGYIYSPQTRKAWNAVKKLRRTKT